MRRFYLDKPHAKFLGVCAGVAAYTGWDAMWVRLGVIIAVLMGLCLLIPVYFIIALVATARTRHDEAELYVRPQDWSGYRGRFADIQAELRSLEARLSR